MCIPLSRVRTGNASTSFEGGLLFLPRRHGPFVLALAIGTLGDRRIYGFPCPTHARLHTIRCLRRAYPKSVTLLDEVATTLCPPYGVLKNDSAFRIADFECFRVWVSPLPNMGQADRARPGDCPDRHRWRSVEGNGSSLSGRALPCLTRQAMMARISAGSRITAMTDIVLPHTGQRNGSIDSN
jgi:hypothetical protein